MYVVLMHSVCCYHLVCHSGGVETALCSVGHAGVQNPMGRKLKDASVAVGDSAGTGTNSAPAGYNTGAGSTSGRKLQDAVVGTGDGGAAVSVCPVYGLII